MIEDGGLIPEHLAGKFADAGTIFGIGATVRTFLRNRDAGLPWERCGAHSAGNGALMRISPMLVPYLRAGGTDLWSDVALATMVTHNDEAAISSALAFVALYWDLLDMHHPPEAAWWVERYVALAGALEGDTSYQPRYKDPENAPAGPLWEFVEEKLPRADEQGLSTLQACESWQSGAYLLETVPCALYILMQHGHDPEEAIVRAVNDTWDNDTVASIVGAAVGALHGRNALPQRWLDHLTGRTAAANDGHIFKVLDQARARFWG